MDTSPTREKDETLLNRREALKRAALVLGVALSPSIMLAAIESDRSTAGSGKPWSPKSLSPDQAAVLDQVTELILPQSDTPGARDVGVAQFIDSIFEGYLREKEQQQLLHGLSKWAQQGFHHKSVAEQTRMMLAIGHSTDSADTAFLARVRELTISGYFTSERVMKEVLNYNPVPGRFRGCVPVAENGNLVIPSPKLSGFSTAPTGPTN